MAAPIFVEMVPKKYGLLRRTARWEIDLSLAAAGATVWILVPLDSSSCQITAEPSGAATARLEACTDPEAAIRAGTAPTAITAWPDGNVTAITAAILPPVTAYRLVQVGAGATRITAVAQ
jgi:hypothetical protein